MSSLSACSTIIGVSDYEIDPGLDSAGKPSGGSGTDTAGKAPVEAGAGGDDTSVAGKSAGGSGGDGGSAGSKPENGDAGMGGDPVVGCQSADECDDTIDCTTDTCNAKHECVHTAKDTLCDASLCETCQAGIGCVAGDKTTMQLLTDANFEMNPSDWTDAMSDGDSVVTMAGAQSGTHVASFGPGDITAKTQYYADLLQWVTIPEGTVALNLTGYYKLTPGTFKVGDDYVVAAFYEDGGTKPLTQFHSFEAKGGAQAGWKMFAYNIPKTDDVPSMAGNEYTFDLVAHVWESVYQFDSLQLNATICQ